MPTHLERATPAPELLEIIGVYDAASSITGELAYWVRSRLGRDQCSLCHVTHAPRGPREDWQAVAATLPAPFVTFHRNDQPRDVRALGRFALPVVLVRTSASVKVMLEREDIASCAGSAHALGEAIRSRLTHLVN